MIGYGGAAGYDLMVLSCMVYVRIWFLLFLFPSSYLFNVVGLCIAVETSDDNRIEC